jgi:hypothetical protein
VPHASPFLYAVSDIVVACQVHYTHLKDYFEATSAEALQQFFDLAAEYLRA